MSLSAAGSHTRLLWQSAVPVSDAKAQGAHSGRIAALEAELKATKQALATTSDTVSQQHYLSTTLSPNNTISQQHHLSTPQRLCVIEPAGCLQQAESRKKAQLASTLAVADMKSEMQKMLVHIQVSHSHCLAQSLTFTLSL